MVVGADLGLLAGFVPDGGWSLGMFTFHESKADLSVLVWWPLSRRPPPVRDMSSCNQGWVLQLQ